MFFLTLRFQKGHSAVSVNRDLTKKDSLLFIMNKVPIKKNLECKLKKKRKHSYHDKIDQRQGLWCVCLSPTHLG